jgi:hypothetical protein
MMKRRKKMTKLVPGFKFYRCEECGHEWTEKSRDCKSPSMSTCPYFNDDWDRHVTGVGQVTGREEHPEWTVDRSGNLI